MEARPESGDILRQRAHRGARPGAERSPINGARSLARLHARLGFRLREFLVPGDLWLLYQLHNPFVVFRDQALFDDAFDLIFEGRRAVGIIGKELADFPRIHALVAGHVVPLCDNSVHGESNSYEAFLRARLVADVLVEAGVYPARVVSAGIVRCDENEPEVTSVPHAADAPLVITICFGVLGEDLEYFSREHGVRPP
jgi:hypothetical protein